MFVRAGCVCIIPGDTLDRKLPRVQGLTHFELLPPCRTNEIKEKIWLLHRQSDSSFQICIHEPAERGAWGFLLLIESWEIFLLAEVVMPPQMIAIKWEVKLLPNTCARHLPTSTGPQIHLHAIRYAPPCINEDNCNTGKISLSTFPHLRKPFTLGSISYPRLLESNHRVWGERGKDVAN